MLVFVDSSAWVALGLRKDQANHERAVSFLETIRENRAVLATTDYVLDETFTVLMRRKVDVRKLADFKASVDESVRSGYMKLVRIDEETFRSAWGVFEKFCEHGISFTDCTSCVVARKIQADCVFGFDEHFRIMGLDLKP
jgi:uncharacterized protein